MSTYEERAAEVGRLVEEKQRAYSDSFGKAGGIMRILYPDGVPPEKLDDALTIVRVIDKLFRVSAHGTADPMGESPWADVMGYSLLALMRVERERAASKDAAATVGTVPP